VSFNVRSSSLKKAGFEVARVKGSHHFLRHDHGRTTVVPVHSGEAIGSGLLSKILRNSDIDRETLQEFL
jgi:predicted RNA binding protein YcfA (HicA-like mRNA interferase family)